MATEIQPEPKTDIAAIFAKDPLELTKTDISALIAKLRDSRKQFTLGNQKAGAMKPKAASGKAKQVTDVLGTLKLDLDL